MKSSTYIHNCRIKVVREREMSRILLVILLAKIGKKSLPPLAERINKLML